MAYFIGLDSGGTKTECWLGDESRMLGRAACGTVKLTRVGQKLATERLRELLQATATSAGVGLAEVSRTCVGVAGFSLAEVREWAARVVSGLVGGTVEVCGDDEIALDAAFHGSPGVLVIAGTGSSVMGRCADGTKFSAGGWGPGVADEGSGFWIGREAVRQAFRALDREIDTGLLEAVRLAWGLEDMATMVSFANARPGPNFAALVPAIVRRASAGDALAASILEAAGLELGDQVLVVLDRLQRHGEEAVEVAFTGSILQKIPAVLEAMTSRIGGRCTIFAEAVNPMEGALWRARQGFKR